MERGPEDYDRDTDEHIARVVLQTMQAFPYMSYKSHNGNGNGIFIKWLLGVTSALLVAGITADVIMTYNFGLRLTVVEVQLAWLLKQK